MRGKRGEEEGEGEKIVREGSRMRRKKKDKEEEREGRRKDEGRGGRDDMEDCQTLGCGGPGFPFL